MVRAFDIFHFEGQLVETIPKPNIIVPASNNRLILSRKPHSLEYYDIPDGSVIKEFPVLNDVTFVVYCAFGDYVATIENVEEDGQSVRMCRVYMNWSTNARFPPLEDNSVNLIKKRLPGQKYVDLENDKFDVIEIPNKHVSIMCCCQSTGKIIICCGHQIHIYSMRRMTVPCQYIDFQGYPFKLVNNFVPIGADIVERVLTLYRMDRMTIYELDVAPAHYAQDYNNDYENDEIDEMFMKKTKIDDAMDTNDVISINNVIDLADDNEVMPPSLEDQLDEISLPFLVTLPGINQPRIKINAAGTPKRKEDITIIYENNDAGIAALGFTVKKILKLHRPLNCHREDYFKCVVSRPLYKDPPTSVTPLMNLTLAEAELIKKGVQSVSVYAILHLLVSTHEAYLYGTRLKRGRIVSNHLLAEFKFTAPVKNVYLDHYILHALTEAGIETFSIPFKMFMRGSGSKEDVPEFEDSVKLLGIHPFIGVVDFAVTENYMMIFASPNEKCALNWTVYYLTLPDAMKVYREMEHVANTYKDYDESSYLDMIMSMITILRIALKFKINIPIADMDELKTCFRPRFLECLYCILRKDHVLLWKDVFSVGLGHDFDIMEAIDFMIPQIKKSPNLILGLQYIVRKWVKYKREALTPSIINGIIDKMQIGSDYPLFFARLVLSEPAFMSSAGLKIEPILEKSYQESVNPEMEHMLAFGSLKCMLGNTEEAHKIFVTYLHRQGQESINKVIIDYLVKYHTILFQEDEENRPFFSAFAVFCMENLHVELGSALARIVQKDIKDEATVLSNIDAVTKGKRAYNGSRTLHKFLEQLFSEQRRCTQFNVTLCLQMLATSYVTSLDDVVHNSDGVKEHNYYRSEYVPIFSKRKLPEFLKLLPAVEPPNVFTIQKLQDLVSSGLLTDEIKEQVKKLLHKYDKSVQVHVTVLLMEFEDAVQILVDVCPTALLQYGKEVIYENDDDYEEWRVILAALYEKYALTKDDPLDVYGKCLDDVLKYLARNLIMEKFYYLMKALEPKLADDRFSRYMKLAERFQSSNYIVSLVRNTGQELMDAIQSAHL